MPDMLSRLVLLPAIVACLVLHEAGHGLAAYLLGDRTARDAGRLTLNPLDHVDPVGLLMMLFFGFGWAKPVPVDPSRFGNPKAGMALTALAGPLANVLTAFVAVRLATFAPGAVGSFLSDVAGLSVGLAAFNLIPIPPLDGSRLVLPFLPDGAARAWSGLDRYGWVVLVLASGSGLLAGPMAAIRNALLGIVL